MREKYNLLEQKFGRLNVVEFAGVGNDRKYLWKCICDCGNKEEIIVKGKDLRSGNTKSCGCYQKQRLRETRKKYNTYDLSDEFGIGYTSKGEEFYFDLEDYNKIKKYYWCIEKSGYAIAYIGDKAIRMHLLLFDEETLKGMYVDHIKGNKNDNRKKYLRICTPSQSSMNRRKQKNNTSGITGVSWDSRYDKWRARIKLYYKEIHLGHFDNINDAIKARKEAEEKYFGEYSFNNSRVKEDIYDDQSSCS